eukprot:1350485-Amphidinium_carterae.1
MVPWQENAYSTETCLESMTRPRGYSKRHGKTFLILHGSIFTASAVVQNLDVILCWHKLVVLDLGIWSCRCPELQPRCPKVPTFTRIDVGLYADKVHSVEGGPDGLALLSRQTSV